MDASESTPEYDIFKRIEELEALKPTAEDGRILAVDALILAFIALVRDHPRTARKLKDSYLAHLETSNLSPELLKELERFLIIVCDELEK